MAIIEIRVRRFYDCEEVYVAPAVAFTVDDTRPDFAEYVARNTAKAAAAAEVAFGEMQSYGAREMSAAEVEAFRQAEVDADGERQ